MDETSNSRRRRGVGVVTPIACTECRKKRSKCDGQAPCQRCLAQSTECVYEAPVRQSKETMRNEIEQLHAHRRQSERVLGALGTSVLGRETFNRLRNGESLEAVSEWLEKSSRESATVSQNSTTYDSPSNFGTVRGTLKIAESVTVASSAAGSAEIGQPTWSNWQSDSRNPYSVGPTISQGEDAMNWTPTEQSEQQNNPSPGLSCPLIGSWHRSDSGHSPTTPLEVSRIRGQDRILGPSYGSTEYSPNPSKSAASWTNITADGALVEHFMALYFCWEYPTFASLSKEHFLTDFRSGRPRFCSSLLVNAMLALGCRFSSLPEARADPENRESTGDHFFAEAERLIAEDDNRSLTSIQALALLSIREGSCGRDTTSQYYAGQAIRLATELGLHVEVESPTFHKNEMEHEVRIATFWGAFALDQAWSLMIGRISHFSRAVNLVSKPAIIAEIEASEWIPYTDQGAPNIKHANQPSNVRSVFRCFCELSELVQRSLYVLYTPGRRLTSNEILAVYTRYLNWYSSLPDALRLGLNYTPAVLFTHLYYHATILLLFRPFIKLGFVGSSVSPREVCVQSADAINKLVSSYDKLYTLRRTPSFVPYMVLMSSITHLISSTHSGTKQIEQGLKDLRAMNFCHGFAGQAINILRFLAHHWELDKKLGDNLGGEDSPSHDEVAAACGPITTSTNMFAPNMGTMLPDIDLKSTDSAIFSPFPMQGRPLISSDSQLIMDGFAKLE